MLALSAGFFLCIWRNKVVQFYPLATKETIRVRAHNFYGANQIQPKRILVSFRFFYAKIIN